MAEAAAELFQAQAPAPQEVGDVSNAEAESDAAQVVPAGVQGFVVDEMAPIRAKAVDHGPGLIKAVGVSILAFGVWCACVALVPSLFARTRRHAQPARLEEPQPPPNAVSTAGDRPRPHLVLASEQRRANLAKPRRPRLRGRT